MRLVTDVPDVGTGRGVRFYACTGCDHIHMRPIDWQEHFATEDVEVRAKPKAPRG
jgi:hypothetical protein